MKSVVLMFLIMTPSIHGSTMPERILLATQVYQESGNDSLSIREHERIVPVLRCIFDNLSLDMEVLEMPWVRAKRELQAGNVEGIFLTSEKNISLGVPTNPVYLEKWHAYTVKPPDALGETPRLGVIRGSDEHQWLLSQGMSRFMEAVSYSQLFKLLSADRVQAFIADSKSLALDNMTTPNNNRLYSTFVRYAAKTLTFSKQYVESNPKIVQRFNASITHCNTEVTTLSEVERAKILEYVSTTVLPQFDNAIRENAFEALSALSADQSEILHADKLWRDAFTNGTRTAVADEILANELSISLRRIKKNNPVIGEIMLTNADGVLLAASDYTSDYWQGDEIKVSALEELDFYLSDIKYDESTRKFIAHYSSHLKQSPLYGAPEKPVILIVGILLEDLLIESFIF
ncbi:hypothetical protein [Alteromonas sp. H39]|uniref:hypothetical protein n=1 Tax=Alteromonas sp. H39 TaxID=3389876 RepID=UPI0039E07011